MTYTIVLDGCGLLILLLLLIPHFSENPSGRFNRRKRDLLLYSALLHFFVLCVRLTGSITALTLPGTAAAKVFRIVAIAPAAASAVFLVLCILCDAEGRVRLPKGQGIPVGQIACAVLPPVLAICLRLIAPGLDFLGVAWSLALHLIQSFILADSEKQLKKRIRSKSWIAGRRR